MSVTVNNDSVVVSYNKEFMFCNDDFYTFTARYALIFIFFSSITRMGANIFFMASLSALIAHLKTFFKGEDVFLCKVERVGCYFQARQTHLLSLKAPFFNAWLTIIKVLFYNIRFFQKAWL